MAKGMSVSRGAGVILAVFLDDPTSPRYGAELCRLTGVKPLRLYPILARLEAMGWLESHWEEPDRDGSNRPRRRCYRITSSGVANATPIVEIGSHRRTHRKYLFPLPGWGQ